MAETKIMRADEIVAGFNGATDRKYWKASIAGTRVNPEVHFNSRASMVCIVYRIATDDFTVTFAKSSAAFGDFLASAYRSMGQVLASLKAGGLPFSSPFSDAAPGPVLRIEYDAMAKTVVIHMARQGDDWLDADPISFKVPERNNVEKFLSGVDDTPVL